MNNKVVLRPARASDFVELLDEPLPYRVRAITAERNGKLLGVGGLAFMPDGVVGAFVHASDEGRRCKIAMHKAGLMTMRMAREMGLRRVVAMADEGIPPAKAWLKRLGFKPKKTDNEVVWIWQISA
jgi:hypothetical protein